MSESVGRFCAKHNEYAASGQCRWCEPPTVLSLATPISDWHAAYSCDSIHAQLSGNGHGGHCDRCGYDILPVAARPVITPRLVDGDPLAVYPIFNTESRPMVRDSAEEIISAALYRYPRTSTDIAPAPGMVQNGAGVWYTPTISKHNTLVAHLRKAAAEYNADHPAPAGGVNGALCASGLVLPELPPREPDPTVRTDLEAAWDALFKRAITE